MMNSFDSTLKTLIRALIIMLKRSISALLNNNLSHTQGISAAAGMLTRTPESSLQIHKQLTITAESPDDFDRKIIWHMA